MPECTSCGAVNPEGAKFCASCGKPIIQEPRPAICAGCGTQNPPGGKFCKNCGASLQTGAAAGPVTVSTTYTVQAPDQTVQQLKRFLWIGGAVFAFSALDGFSNIYMMESVYGMWARTEIFWFLTILDLACAGIAFYAATQVAKGERRLAKTAFVVMMVLGGLGLFRTLSMGFRFFPVMLFGFLLYAGFRGWQLITKEKQLQAI